MKARIAVLGTVGKSLLIDTAATDGATVGVNLRLADGTIPTLAQLQALFAVPAAAGTNNGLANTIWRLVREIPANVVEVEQLTGAGLVTRQADGNWLVRSLAVESDGLLQVADASGNAGNPTLGAASIDALSVWARAGNTAGKPAPVVAASDTTVLRRAGTSIGFGALTSAYVSDFVEAAQDATAALLQAGTGISFAYDDAANTLTPTVTLAPFTTTNLSEGTNLYYTAARFDAALATKTTSNLAEGTNLYFTDGRAQAALAAQLALKLDIASYTAADVFAKVLTLDGAGSGLDADTLDGISSAGFVSAGTYTAADVLAKLLTVDGAGSGLDADLLDGNSSAAFLLASAYTAADVLAKLLTVDGAGSGLDADLLDGLSSAAFFQTSAILTAINGTLAAPTYGFSDVGLGMYRSSTNQLGLAAAGALIMSVGNTGFALRSGLVMQFNNAVENAAANISNSGSSGVSRLSMTLSSVERFAVILDAALFRDGTVTAPGRSYILDPNSGEYRIGADHIGWSTNATLALGIDATQRIYGKALHNNASSPTGTSLQYIASGTYTPTLDNTTNVAASTASQCQWMRVGNVVTVSGRVSVDPTAAGQVVLGISLPLASNLGALEDCAGTACASGVAGQSAAIWGDVANDRAAMEWVAVDLTNQGMSFTFTYEII